MLLPAGGIVRIHEIPWPSYERSCVTKVCRGVRGATTSDSNCHDDILQATTQLLALMIRRNGIESEDVASVIFTTTPDLDAAFPAVAARQLGWLHVPLLCMHEINVPDSLPMCVRVLIHWNTATPQSDIEHIYVKDATSLRPDLCDRLAPADLAELEKWIEDYTDP